MAKVTITLTDDVGGLVRCIADFEPPIDRGDHGTPAQHAAAQMLDIATKAAEVESIKPKFARRTKR